MFVWLWHNTELNKDINIHHLWMASITAPNSPQIRLAFSASNSTKFTIFLHSRFPHFDPRRVRLFCVAKNGDGSGSVPVRVGSDGSPNSAVKKINHIMEELWEWEWLEFFFFQGLLLLPCLSADETVPDK